MYIASVNTVIYRYIYIHIYIYIYIYTMIRWNSQSDSIIWFGIGSNSVKFDRIGIWGQVFSSSVISLNTYFLFQLYYVFFFLWKKKHSTIWLDQIFISLCSLILIYFKFIMKYVKWIYTWIYFHFILPVHYRGQFPLDVRWIFKDFFFRTNKKNTEYPAEYSLAQLNTPVLYPVYLTKFYFNQLNTPLNWIPSWIYL